jgi:hypothetical protein
MRLLIVPGLALLALGAEGLFQAARGRVPVAIDCAEFARQRPPSNRLLVTGCELDFAGAGYRESGGELAELYVPARPSGQLVPAPLVLASRDQVVLSAARGLVTTSQSATPGQPREARETLAGLLQSSRAIDGLARSGIVERIRSRRILSGLASPIAQDAVIVDVGGTPDFMRPIIAVIAGFLLTLLPFARRSQQPQVEAEGEIAPGPARTEVGNSAAVAAVDAPHVPRAPATAGAAVAPVALPRLLLLDVGHDAGPEAIEKAPPLGKRQDVIEILRGVVPDLEPDKDGRVLARADGSLALDLGTHDPVPTAVIDAHSEGGVALVREILLMTGWRAFAPKTGLFVSADDLAALQALVQNPEA